MSTEPSKIEWTEQTWNPVTGCAKVSAGCKHCYCFTTPDARIKLKRLYPSIQDE